MEVLVFASRDARGAGEARALATAVGARYVDRLSPVLEDTLLVAKYRILEPVVIIAVVGERIVARIPRLVSAEALQRDLVGIA